MGIEGKACRYRRLLMLFPCIWTWVKWLERVNELYRALSTRNSEAFWGSERNLRLFSVSGIEWLIGWIHQPWGRMYIERAMELNLNSLSTDVLFFSKDLILRARERSERTSASLPPPPPSPTAFAVMSRGLYFSSRARQSFEEIEPLWTD